MTKAAAVRAAGTSLTGLFGVGPVIAAVIVDVRRRAALSIAKGSDTRGTAGRRAAAGHAEYLLRPPASP